MHTRILIGVVVAFSLLAFFSRDARAAAPGRERILLDAGWRFHRGDFPEPVSGVTITHWNWQGKEGQPIDVWCYSNADRVELFLNGKSLGAKEMPRLGHLEWSVPYAPGTLEARGYDSGGQVVARGKVETTGPPAASRLTTDRKTLTADGEDVTPVEVDVVDAQGRIVPTADNLVTFSVQGAGHVAGVGNGDPSDHDPDKANFRHAFNGKCMVLVGAGEQPGSIQLTAASSGLKSVTLRIHAISHG